LDALFPGVGITSASGINNARQIVAVSGYGSNGQGWLYTPGAGIMAVPAAGGISNTGHILTLGTAPYGNMNIQAYYIWTQAGDIPVPVAPSLYWTGLNDNDEVVGVSFSDVAGNSGAVYYSVATGRLVVLSGLAVNNTGGYLYVAQHINNQGEIVVIIRNPDFTEDNMLLIPSSFPALKTAAAASRSRTWRVNGVCVTGVFGCTGQRPR
jgi:hypothetical protein